MRNSQRPRKKKLRVRFRESRPRRGRELGKTSMRVLWEDRREGRAPFPQKPHRTEKLGNHKEKRLGAGEREKIIEARSKREGRIPVELHRTLLIHIEKKEAPRLFSRRTSEKLVAKNQRPKNFRKKGPSGAGDRSIRT